MNFLRPFLAQVILPTDVLPGSHWLGLSLKELLVVLGAVAGVTLILVIWAAYFRKSPRRHSHHHHAHSHTQNSGSSAPNNSDAEMADEKHFRRKRRRRREHRPRNPTLAETGGLPPLRADPPRDPLP